MASHDFCQGCPKCDAEEALHAKNLRRHALNETIENLRNLKPSKVFENGQEKIEHVISMLMMEIDKIR